MCFLHLRFKFTKSESLSINSNVEMYQSLVVLLLVALPAYILLRHSLSLVLIVAVTSLSFSKKLAIFKHYFQHVMIHIL